MKKTDFPDKCSGCRLLNREKMRAELEGTSKKPQKETPAQYSLTVVEGKKGKITKSLAPKKPAKEEEKKQVEQHKGPIKFAELIKEGSKEFPALPEP